MRPRQWSKNVIVFMALVFSIDDKWQLTEPSTWLDLLGWSVVTFVLLCLISSADYLVNDVIDRESDRRHPTKRNRPIAAGLLSVRAALIWAVIFASVAIGGAFALTAPLTWHVGAVISGYLVLMVAYTLVLKHIVLIDMLVIGAGFVLRAMAGGLAIDVPISPWLYVVTALGALFLIINKRRAEITLLESGAANHRPILEEYSLALLDQIGALVTASTLIAYGLYTFTAENLPDNNSMMLTIPFVLYGLLRYLYLVDRHKEGGSPEEVLLKDRPLQIDILLWLATAAAVLVVFRD
ncbi:MAG: decaprenyl-phosphate phosphoribosyltransferase [Chloroflexi bacterium]|nr:decaprenyl-phosphate phosphoribosyltransferase [Chloroflexota bacterium]